MVLQQILGILLISGAIIFVSAPPPDKSVLSGFVPDQHNQSDVHQTVLGAADTKESPNGRFKTEIFWGSGSQLSREQLVEEEKITLFPEDRVKVFPDPELGIGFMMTVERALAVKIKDGLDERIYRTFQTSVRGVLDEKEIELGDQDMIEPSLDSQLEPGTAISIVRVSEAEIKLRQKIDFSTDYQDDPNLDKGFTRLVRSGGLGEKELTYQVRRENGQEVSRKLINTQILIQPVNKLVARGTREVVYGVGLATWFGAPPLTAAHNSLPRGTMVEVTNLQNGKTVIVKVIGGGIRGRAMIDLSSDAFEQLASLNDGVIKVKISQP